MTCISVFFQSKQMANSFILSITQISLITITTLFVSSSPFSNASETSIPSRPFKKVFAFGDSYTDTGNTQSSTGPSSFTYVSSPPYGSTFFHHPTNRYSDGRLVIDFVMQALKMPFLPPYRDPKLDKLNGVNFAVAGSTAIIHSFFAKNNLTLNITPQSLQTQLIWFNKYLESNGCKGSTTIKECEAELNDALFWVGEIGANDYAYSFASSVSSQTIQKLAIYSVTNFIQALLTKGAKYLLVQGLPPTGCLTLSLALAPILDRDNMGCVASVNRQTYLHNAILQAKLNDLRKKFPQAVIVYADYWHAYASIVKKADKYGYKELFRVCCGSGGGEYNFNAFGTCGSPLSTACENPSQYINWDGVHLTEAMYKALADSFLNGTYCQPPFGHLLGKKVQS